MRRRDSFDVMCSVLAAAADAVAIAGGFMLAVWIRFDSGWIPLRFEGEPPRMMYLYASIVVTLLFLFIFQRLGLYARPQFGRYSDRIPRLVRACGMGILLALALASIVRTTQPFSRFATAIAFATVTALVVVERNILFQCERHWAKYQAGKRRIVIVGTGPLALRLKKALEGEPRRRAKVAAFLRIGDEPVHEEIAGDLVKGTHLDLPALLESAGADEVILCDSAAVPPAQRMDMLLACERNLALFQMVPDMFRLLTTKMDMETVDDIPLLGASLWPLDHYWNRCLKRVEDIAGAAVGLVLSAPVIAVAAAVIKVSSPGPIFYRQVRCGEKGRAFTLYKLRSMPVDAEKASGPVWAAPDDPRRTPIGRFLREHNLDELPQFWNVLKGDMSLVGPRPERPHFVEQFKEDISRYMWRHVSKPGMTGWAQVNGLRGQTSIRDRIEYDLFYLENWSLALDFKILARTLLMTRNAY